MKSTDWVNVLILFNVFVVTDCTLVMSTDMLQCLTSFIIDSAPARSLLFLSLTLSVCMFVTLIQIDSSSLYLPCFSMESSHFLAISSPWQKLQNVVLRILICCPGNEIWAIFGKISNCFFFFVFRWNRAIFCQLVLRDPSTKRCSSIFDLGPLTPKINSPKFGQKSPITRLVWQIDQKCLRLIGGFRGWPIEWNHKKCCRADRCCHGNENLATFGYFFKKIDSSFLFVDGIEPFLGRQFSMWHSTKCCS